MKFEVKLLEYLDTRIQSIKDNLEKLVQSDALSDDECDEIRQLEAERQTFDAVKEWVVKNTR